MLHSQLQDWWHSSLLSELYQGQTTRSVLIKRTSGTEETLMTTGTVFQDNTSSFSTSVALYAVASTAPCLLQIYFPIMTQGKVFEVSGKVL